MCYVLPYRSVQYNITRERGWRPIWEKELANVKNAYESGKMASGFHPEDPIHKGVALWVWAKIVQLRLDNIKRDVYRLIEQYTPPDLFQFGMDKMVARSTVRRFVQGGWFPRCELGEWTCDVYGHDWAAYSVA
ncbi:hypothetical protein FB451DRAFT_1179327 [Mycena latifolia]|nr:hypothetical protein FB451DRAFT_1179327 [Mycena latifolia]